MEQFNLTAAAATAATADPRLAGIAGGFIAALIQFLFANGGTLFPSLGPTPTPASVKDHADTPFASTVVAHHVMVQARQAWRRGDEGAQKLNITQALAVSDHYLNTTIQASDDDVQQVLTAQAA
jgi:hypothetical protein